MCFPHTHTQTREHACYYGIAKDSNHIPAEGRVLLLLNIRRIMFRVLFSSLPLSCPYVPLLFHYLVLKRPSVCVLPLRLENLSRTNNRRSGNNWPPAFIPYNRPHGIHLLIKQFPSCCVCVRCCVDDVITEPLRSTTDTNTDWWEGFMKYSAEMEPGAVIYIPVFLLGFADLMPDCWLEVSCIRKLCDRPTRSRFSVVFVGPRTMHCMLPMQPSQWWHWKFRSALTWLRNTGTWPFRLVESRMKQ
jgi:hypothetical protein